MTLIDLVILIDPETERNEIDLAYIYDIPS